MHLGSLTTALAAWLQARRHRGIWLIRVDDLDSARCKPGSAGQILEQLQAHGLQWDESPRYQSAHVTEYQKLFDHLQELGHAYPCACTRAELARSCHAGPDGPVYPGTCRPAKAGGAALRLRLAPGRYCLDDAWLGLQCRDLEHEVGDYVLLRADGIAGYQLACVADDLAQGITEVVRGADLLGSSIRQAYLLDRLGQPKPAYRHLPVLTRSGRKLSKQNHAAAIDVRKAAHNLWDCLHLLTQGPPPGLRSASVDTILAWALEHWQPSAFAGARERALEE